MQYFFTTIHILYYSVSSEMIFLIIRLGKFEAVIICTVIMVISFLFAINGEKRTAAVSATTEYVSLPIIMYHHVTTDKAKTGRYTVHVSELEKDIIYLKENGYNTVTVSDLIDYTENGEPLPENPIMITFDDGFESFYSLAYPLLRKNEMKSVVSVIGKVTEKYSENEDHNINYSNLTFDQINELYQSGYVEIQNHSYDMHLSTATGRRGISRKSKESKEDYSNALAEDLLTVQKILKLKCGILPTCVVYPYGAYSKETLPIIKKLGFKSTMLCEERINKILKNDPDSLYNLGRYNRESGISTEDFFSRIINKGL